MNELKYTITKFDETLKLVDVMFDDGSWAQIRLAVPLPKNIGELEQIIKQFAAPVEAIEAQNNPDADLSFIVELVGTSMVCERNRIKPETSEDDTIDAELEAQILAKEQEDFETNVTNVLKKIGVLHP